jgi:hypothetical protein
MTSLINGEKNILVNARWPVASKIDQGLFYDDFEREIRHYALHFNADVEAMEEGFDNIPYVRVDFGRVPWLLAIAYGCTPVRIGNLINAKPRFNSIPKPEDLVPAEQIYDHGYYPEIARRMQLIEERFGDLPFVPSDTQSPIDVATQLVDTQTLLMGIYDEPEAVRSLLAEIAEAIDTVLQKQRKAVHRWLGFGHDYPLPRGLHLSNDNAAFLSPDVYRAYVLPSIEPLAERYNGITLHCCMGYSQNLEVMSSCRGFLGFDPQVAYNPIDKIIPAISGRGFWRNHSIKPDDEALNTYKKIIDNAGDTCGLLMEVRGRDKDHALELAADVSDYAAS